MMTRIVSFISLLLTVSSPFYAQKQLIIPAALSGTEFNLELQKGSFQFFDGKNTSTMGVNGDILGPTLIFQQGDSVNIHLKNNLDEETTIHWHGMHVSAENDGGPHTVINPGSTWEPGFRVLDRAGTYWYHPHLHMHTNEHVSKGIAGFVLVRDKEEETLQLPRNYGIDDFPIVIQTKDFDTDYQILSGTNADNVVMVNATINGQLDVPANIIRLRLLNGSSMRTFHVGMANNMSFYMIASDGGLLSESIKLTRLRLAPGERAEILIDLSTSKGQVVDVKSFASELPNGIYGASLAGMSSMMTLNGYSPNPLNGTNFTLFSLHVADTVSNEISQIPVKLSDLKKWDINSVNQTRNLTFSPKTMGMNQLNGSFVINGAGFNMNTINYTIPLNNIEIWNLSNQSAIAHPFHIHDVQFFVLDRNGVSPPASESGSKDVILVPPMENVRFITKFEHHANSKIPYMYHCHMLIHEDDGMMGQFVVVDKNNSLEVIHSDNSMMAFPNPCSDLINFDTSDSTDKILKIDVFNTCGEKVVSVSGNKTGTQTISLGYLNKGTYIAVVEVVSGIKVTKFIRI